jgi:hypothetical protein
LNRQQRRRRVLTGVVVLAGLLALMAAATRWLQVSPPRSAGTPAEIVVQGPEGAEPHPVLGHRFPPNSESWSRYSANPRSYFEPDMAGIEWKLDSQPGSSASLDLPETPSVHDRIAVRKIQAGSDLDWHIQLHTDQLFMRERAPYVLQFRARAGKPRPISFSVAQSHPPWQTLGLYGKETLTPFWQSFEERFTSPASDQNARIQFNLGGSGSEVEIEKVRLLRQDTMESVVPARGFVVRYRFDRLGCRGVDRAIPPESGSFRILALGGSETFGVGVHEGDTFSSRLERMLNATTNAQRAALAFEVVNCGVDRYDVRQARLFYELVAAGYQPHLVLLAVAPNEAGVAEKGEQRVAAAVVDEILELKRTTLEHHTRLGVVTLRTQPLEQSPEWAKLLNALPGKLEEAGVPFRDLGVELMARHEPAELRVLDDADPHPNETAHRLAAEDMVDFLRVEGLLAKAKADETQVAAGGRP